MIMPYNCDENCGKECIGECAMERQSKEFDEKYGFDMLYDSEESKKKTTVRFTKNDGYTVGDDEKEK